MEASEMHVAKLRARIEAQVAEIVAQAEELKREAERWRRLARPAPLPPLYVDD
jgi:hypothetical protein